MNDIVYVGIAQCEAVFAPGTLACAALGSCVAICLWDGRTRLAGLAHALLPSPAFATDRANPLKFADEGARLLAARMEALGARRDGLRAKLVGGACLYRYERACVAAEVGARNVSAAREALAAMGIPILAEHVGGERGRSIRLDAETFEIRVRVLSGGETSI